VIDAIWEPEEVCLPPHRRSVPLTLEQVQAQMPPQFERRRSSDWEGDECCSSYWEDDDDDNSDEDEDLSWD